MEVKVVRVDLVLPSGTRAYVEDKLSPHRVAFVTDEVSRHLVVHDGLNTRDLVYADELGGLVDLPAGPGILIKTSTSPDPSVWAVRSLVAGSGVSIVNANGVSGNPTISCTITNHALLSATHTDTVSGAVARGSLVVGNSTPAWSALTIGAAGTFLISDGTAPAWGTALIKAGTIKAISDHLTLTNLANATDMVGTGTGILFRQAYYDVTTPAVADACRIWYSCKGDWTAGTYTQYASAHLGLAWGIAGLTEALRVTASETGGKMFKLFEKTILWDTADEITAIGMEEKQYAEFGYTSSVSGGLTIRGAKDSDFGAIRFEGIVTGDPISSDGVFTFNSNLTSGSSVTGISGSGKLFRLTNAMGDVLSILGNGTILQQTDVLNFNHGITDFLLGDAYSSLGPVDRAHPEYGGLRIIGASVSSSTSAVQILAFKDTSCNSQSFCDIIAGIKICGTGVGAINSDEYALRVWNDTNSLLGIYGDGVVKITSLAGTGTRNVVVDAFGRLSAP